MKLPRYGTLEKSWTWICLFTGTLFAVVMSASIYFDGLGVVREGGVFLLRKGVVREIDQRVGFLIFNLGRLLLIAMPASMIVTLFVFLKHSTVAPDEIFDSSEEGRSLRNRLRIAQAFSIVPIAYLFLSLLWGCVN